MVEPPSEQLSLSGSQMASADPPVDETPSLVAAREAVKIFEGGKTVCIFNNYAEIQKAGSYSRGVTTRAKTVQQKLTVCRVGEAVTTQWAACGAGCHVTVWCRPSSLCLSCVKSVTLEQ